MEAAPGWACQGLGMSCAAPVTRMCDGDGYEAGRAAARGSGIPRLQDIEAGIVGQELMEAAGNTGCRI